MTFLSQANSDKESLENVSITREQQVARGKEKRKKQLQKNVSAKYSSLPKNFTFYAGSAPMLQNSTGKEDVPDPMYESFVACHYHQLLNEGILWCLSSLSFILLYITNNLTILQTILAHFELLTLPALPNNCEDVKFSCICLPV